MQTSKKAYSVTNVVDELDRTLQTYLEAQYHIWDESLIRERKAFLEKAGTISQIPLLEATPHYAYGENFSKLSIPNTAKILLTKISEFDIGLYPTPYHHQSEALQKFLGDDKNIIIATGTGSGKTESFLMPLIASLAIEADEKPETSNIRGIRSLILYPMNALVNDQMSRLRKIFGDKRVASLLSQNRQRNVTFGMYTGRTAYPGKKSSEKDRDILKKIIQQLSGNNSEKYKEILSNEGKWPAKDMDSFIKSGFKTHPDDRELFSRHEMQENCPDILVTNYSMLEYMLIRPIEFSIFEQTKEWLNADSTNKITVVIDEAHMYRGAAGAEVGLLLRRFQSRLGIGRDRIRYILTSASLGSTDEAKIKVKEFAADLTGLNDEAQAFHLITGEIEQQKNPLPATNKDIAALEAFPYSYLHEIDANFDRAIDAFKKLTVAVGSYTPPNILTPHDFRIAINDFLEKYPLACELSNFITSNPHCLQDIQRKVFPNHNDNKALESLMALCTYGQKKDGRVFLPIRLHTFYRGISGIYACINPECSYKNHPEPIPSLLGKFFDFPRRNCDCGSRVYELLTHRECGAAFLRVFIREINGDFAWHQNSSLNPRDSLIEAHFLVETNRSRSGNGSHIWIHKKTGRISRTLPRKNQKDFLNLIRSDDLREGYIGINTFIHECPVCMRKWRNSNIKIMDLATKGEAPFAHLVSTQLKLQPPKLGNKYPNEGRKNLLFSDGRQKAARLARDIPREIQQDVFRQVLLYSVDNFQHTSKKEAYINAIYPAFLYNLKAFNLSLFDGDDANHVRDDLKRINKEDYDNLDDLIQDFRDPPPEGFNQELLRQLGSSFYSLQALTLAYVVPTDRCMTQLQNKISFLNQESIKSLATAWIQTFLDNMALDKKISSGARMRATGFPNNKWGISSGFSAKKKKFIEKLYGRADEIENALKEILTEEESGAYFLYNNKIKIQIALYDNWHQCPKCTYIAPVTFQSHCVECGTHGTIELNPNSSDYLRARKTFWRDPVVSILQNKSKPFSLNVCEHTAQLSYRDQDQVKSTTEEFERLFKDIILDESERPIDILSCTTTMEVGIDIGSLVAVGLRNIPPQRQNYQQRVGRAGRRGAAISTIVTYAQNSPHDHYYFKNVRKIISGEPPLPVIDISNPRLVVRHIHAAVIQYFFHNEVSLHNGKGGVFDAMGKTWDFYNGTNDFTIKQFNKWFSTDTDAKQLAELIQTWVPIKANINVSEVIKNFIIELNSIRPETEEEIPTDSKEIIYFLFNSGLLPSYAFPKDLCAIQIEKWHKEKNYDYVEVVERAQQGLNVALSEYAPGKLIVLNKLTYRIACVAANKPYTEVNRATYLFDKAKTYNHCHDCFYTQPTKTLGEKLTSTCPICNSINYKALTVIQPEIVFAENSRPIDERDDEQIFSSVTNAQLPVTEVENFIWNDLNSTSKYSYSMNQSLIMLNKGESQNNEFVGFEVCNLCGHTVSGGVQTFTSHPRHYLVEGLRVPQKCDGEYINVNLGYSFWSDIFIMRIALKKPIDINLKNYISKKALEDGFLSFCEAISTAACHILDIDPRELKSGYRLTNIQDNLYADIFLYDSIAGGAGYAIMAGQKIEEILDDVEDILSKCNCGSSCQKCLRHYGNKHYHSRLDRKLAIILLNYVRHETFPEIKSIHEQKEELSILQDILELEGWDLIENKDIPLVMKKDSKVLKYSSSPSLFDPLELKHPLQDECTIVSSYRLDNDVTGIFAEVG